MIFKKNYNFFFYILILIIFSHFIPFERASLAPDDYAFFKFQNLWFKNFIYYPDRPLQFLWYEVQNLFINNNVNFAFYTLIFANYLFLSLSFIFYNLFFENKTSFYISIINILIFNKLEIFHNAIMIHIIFVTSLYLISLILLINYFKYKKNTYLIFSYLTYFISIFWYEIGFFLPLIIFFVNFKDYKNFNLSIFADFKKKFYVIFPFLLIIFTYAVLRTTSLFGYALNTTSHSIILNPLPGTLELFHHYFGRYLIKNIVYSLFQLQFITYIYLFIFLSFNLLTVYLISKHYKNIDIKKKYLIFFILIFIFSIVPILLNGQAGGRNLLLANISVSYFIFLIFNFLKKYYYNSFTILILILLFISQGTSWSQTVASRIQNAIFNAIIENEHLISEKKYIIFDTFSLKKNIKHSLVNNDYNLINTYYGSQVWESWGMSGFLNKNKIDKKLIITNKLPLVDSNTITINQVLSIDNYNIQSKILNLKTEDVFILNYNKIFPTGFTNGNKQ